MANKIARGASGQADFSSAFYNGVSGGECGVRFDWSIETNSTRVARYYSEDECGPELDYRDGWDATADGIVTVPSGAALGQYLLIYQIPVVCTLGQPPCNQFGSSFGSNYYSPYRHFFHFEVVCLTVDVNITKLSSAKISGSSPVQYKHKYAVEAKVVGGTKPYSYSWSASSGSLSASGDSGILTITNSNPTAAGISATVTCDVTDSGTCSATDTASIVDGKPAIEGGGPCAGSGNSQKRCNAGGICIQSTGNNPVPSGGSNPQQYGHYGSHGS